MRPDSKTWRRTSLTGGQKERSSKRPLRRNKDRRMRKKGKESDKPRREKLKQVSQAAKIIH